MKRVTDRAVWGIVLIALGGLFLLRNMGVWDGVNELIFGALFAAGGVAFLTAYLGEPSRRWWSIIPACALLGLAGLLVLSSFPGRLGDVLGAPVFMGALSLAFFVVFLTGRDRWWALIPAGALASVTTVIIVETLPLPIDGGAVMMFGLAATFGLVSLVDTPSGKMRWALIPAGIMAGVGLIIVSASLHMVRWLWPLLIIAVGLGFVFKSVGEHKQNAE